MDPIDYAALFLFAVGVLSLLINYLPFSPMTIDIVNLRRETQLKIFRHRKALGVVGVLGLAGAMVLGLTTSAGAGWFWTAAGAGAMLLFMFWSGYVPWVMAAPRGQRVVDLAEADRLLEPGDAVLGLYYQGEARAYPRDLIARPHFLTDTLADKQFTISYCILCNSGVAFISELNGQRLDLDCVTAYNNNIIYRDKRSGNIIQQLDGEVIEGPDRGAMLESLPLAVMGWDEWRRLHPRTTVCYAPALTIRDKMVAMMLEFLIPIAKLSKRTAPWHRVRGELDPRLPAMSYVFGVEIGGERCAFPESFMREHPVHNDVVGGQAIVTLYVPTGDYGSVFSRVLDGKVLTFASQKNADGVDTVVDRETGSTWNIAGEAIEGELSGQTLAPVPHFNKVFWFGWSLFKPGTKIVREEANLGGANAPLAT
jgi:Protein of unknown function (DUF3179)